MAIMKDGALMGRLSGRAGNAVYVNTGYGTVVRDLPTKNDPQTSAQLLNRARQAKAARVWSNLDPEVVARWTAWAANPTSAPPHGEVPRRMRPMNAFTTFYKRLLTFDMAAPPPLFPPARPFFGDVIEVQVSLPLGRGRGGVEGYPELFQQGETGTTPTLPSPTGEAIANTLSSEQSLTPFIDCPEGEDLPTLTLSASGPNTAGVVTELYIQPLASRNRRTYLERYRSQGFTAFPGGAAHAIHCGPGWYACAYRFVNTNTGQATELAELGIVRAEA